MQLSEALRLEAAPRLALVGAGGKTTALFQLAREYLATPRQETAAVLVTTTTHLAVGQALLADHHIVVGAPADLDALAGELSSGVIMFTSGENREGRLAGVDLATLERIRGMADAYKVPLLIEADGSRMKPLKAPATYEPAIPAFVGTVVVVAGLSALGKPMALEWVHRPEIFASLSGLSPGVEITAEALVRVLSHPQGGLKGIPESARRLVLLNQADSPELQSKAGAMARELLGTFQAIAIASLLLPSLVFSVHERVAGVILAAGESRRFGQPKPLLPWRGEPFIRHVVRAAQGARLSPIVVVCGVYTPQIRLACAGLDVQLIHNPDWEAGQSASLQAGLRALPPEIGAAVFLLADQPQVPSGLVTALVEMHAGSLSPLVAPLVDGQRANPVLFDRQTFPDLMALQGDVGGRALFSKYPISWVPWHDPRLLLDIDTPEDYQRLLEMELFTGDEESRGGEGHVL